MSSRGSNPPQFPHGCAKADGILAEVKTGGEKNHNLELIPEVLDYASLFSHLEIKAAQGVQTHFVDVGKVPCSFVKGQQL